MINFTPVAGAHYLHDYPAIFKAMAAGEIPRKEHVNYYRHLCQVDLFFLLHFGLERADTNRPFIVNAANEVQADHDGTLDLWAREHYKSTIITYALVIQWLLNDPEERIAIFSHTRPIAIGFLRQIKQTLEDDSPLKKWFQDRFYLNPKKESPKWSEHDGLIIKRKSKAKEASIEAWGLVDGQPTSKHFTKRVYDDIVTPASVTNPDQIRKTADAYELSQSLGTDGGGECLAGTHYHFADLYMVQRKKKVLKPRVKPATHNGAPDGDPVLLSQERLDELRRKQGTYIFSCQQLLSPVATADQVFRPEWLKYYDRLPAGLNRYLLCDPANEKKKKSDWTTLGAVGIDAQGNHLLLDLVRDKLNLKERWAALRDMHRRWGPIQLTGYEKYGKDSDIQYFEEKMELEGYYFHITPLAGQTAKADRIRQLQPLFEEGRWFLPYHIYYTNYKDEQLDLVKVFIEEELETFPFSIHDDILDMLARIRDPQVVVVAPAGGMSEDEAKKLQAQHGPPAIQGLTQERADSPLGGGAIRMPAGIQLPPGHIINPQTMRRF